MNRIHLISHVFLYLLSAPGANPTAQELKVRFKEVLCIDKPGSFFRIEEITAADNGDILVTDAYGYSVKRFDKLRHLCSEFGRRGKNRGEFRASPYKIVRTAGMLGIVEKGLNTIRLFRDNMEEVKTLTFAGGIVDAAAGSNGKIYINLLPYSGLTEHVLMVVDTSGNITSRLQMAVDRSEPAMNVFHLSVDSRNVLVAANRFMNMVTMYGEDGKMLRSFTIPGLPSQAALETGNDSMSMPAGDIIADVAIDTRRDIYYILGGTYSVHPFRDIFLFGADGKFLSMALLPSKSGILHIDREGNLYTREKERTILKKYKIVYQAGR